MKGHGFKVWVLYSDNNYVEMIKMEQQIGKSWSFKIYILAVFFYFPCKNVSSCMSYTTDMLLKSVIFRVHCPSQGLTISMRRRSSGRQEKTIP